MTEQAARAEDLTRKFGDFVAVDRVTFDVRQSEIFGFLGPNGAGKTTTIKMLCGLLEPTSGRAEVAGIDVVTDPDAVKRNIGYMSQLFSLYADLTVSENIQLFAGLYEVKGSRFTERRDWILEMADLTEHRDRSTGELPLGWKQRLALGCSMLHAPPVLFLDEPTSGVDPLSRRSFWDLINTLAEQGTTVFVSTHYMEEAEYCHRLALMNRGRLIALERPQALRQGMTEPILEFESDDPPKAVELLQGTEGIVEASMYGRRVQVVVTDRERWERELPRVVREGGRDCRELRLVEPSLENVFVSMVRREGGAVIG